MTMNKILTVDTKIIPNNEQKGKSVVLDRPI